MMINLFLKALTGAALLGLSLSAGADSIIVDAVSSSTGIKLSLPSVRPGSESGCEITPLAGERSEVSFYQGSYGAAHFDIPPVEELVHQNCGTVPGHTQIVASFRVAGVNQYDQETYLGMLWVMYDIAYTGQNPHRAIKDISLKCGFLTERGAQISVGTNDPAYPPAVMEGYSCNIQSPVPSIPLEFKVDNNFDRYMFFPYSVVLSVQSTGR
jgi:hypothetical protein